MHNPSDQKATSPVSAAGAIAEGIWKTAKDHNLQYNHVLDACALVIAGVAGNAGMTHAELLHYLRKRLAQVKTPNGPSSPAPPGGTH